MDQEQLKQFLARIAQIESAGGKNTQHPVIQHGMHKGMHAIGQYGLMPLTIQDLAKGSSDPELSSLSQVDPSSLEQSIKQRPDLEQRLAEQLAAKVLERQGGDEARAAYAWNQGHNLTPDRIPTPKLEASPYAQKYQKLAGPKQSMPIQTRPDMAQTELQSSPDISEIESYLQGLAEEQPEEVDLRKPLEDEEQQKSAQLEALKKFLV